MPLDHQLLPVPSDKIGPLAEWLKASLGHLGFKEVKNFGPKLLGLGEGDFAYFWLVGEDEKTMDASTMADHFKRQHICFRAETEEEIKQFHDAAIKAGGIDNGKPGPRPEYHESYYAAFVRDPYLHINWEVIINFRKL